MGSNCWDYRSGFVGRVGKRFGAGGSRRDIDLVQFGGDDCVYGDVSTGGEAEVFGGSGLM